jgi:hypothetical protein
MLTLMKKWNDLGAEVKGTRFSVSLRMISAGVSSFYWQQSYWRGQYQFGR